MTNTHKLLVFMCIVVEGKGGRYASMCGGTAVCVCSLNAVVVLPNEAHHMNTWDMNVFTVNYQNCEWAM